MLVLIVQIGEGMDWFEPSTVSIPEIIRLDS